ncbi:hypothetical protein [Pseudonocardia sp. D17]|uniref:hypothetical protein n=1 Tax=Pseudonocardia sp. D17 TaxID=882661 RepID=UPI002B3A853E|nr:hypothetical protein PSD17_39480 [Pseudonocardia sp. D17]
MTTDKTNPNADDLFALVIRPDTNVAPERVPFKRERLLDVLYELIEDGERQGVDATSAIPTPWGDVRAYVGGHSALVPDVPTNSLALAMVRAYGYHAPDLRGTVVIVGDVDPDGWNGSCPEGLAARAEEVSAIHRAHQ